MSSYSEDLRLAKEVARKMAANPQFRYELTAAIDAEQWKFPDDGTQRLERARAMFEIGQESGRVWIWINGLAFGIGDTFPEAYHDALEELGYALQELREEQR